MCIYESTSNIEHTQKKRSFKIYVLIFLWVLKFKVRLCTHFKPIMKKSMKYILTMIEKLIKVKAQVSEVKSIMLGNIDKVNEKKTQLLNYCKSMCFLCGALIH